ncbi:arylamine N-acetyltransferase family protein [Ornithinimicrobium panacihumi]|uniref:arylamine N-acetyltransferase family protein n=1 Tax=Ornithinimicrobium panacihumi TaxID=2008449 RepID=UPI003F8C90AF
MNPPSWRADYLRRLGAAEVTRPDLETLRALHRAHVERIPYSTLELVLGRPAPADVESSVARVLEGRGGYCFHLNAAFAWLLHELGYAVTHHRAGVQGRGSREPVGTDGSHLALTVDLGRREGRWLVDVGLGSALHGPLELREGAVDDGDLTLHLRRSEMVPGGWRLEHDPRALSFVGVDIDPRPVTLTEAVEHHDLLSTSPRSPFVRRLSVQRRDSRGLDALTGVGLRRVERHRETYRVLGSVEELDETLQEVFGLELGRLGVGSDRVERLFSEQHADTTRWLTSQSP